MKKTDSRSERALKSVTETAEERQARMESGTRYRASVMVPKKGGKYNRNREKTRLRKEEYHEN